MVTLKSNKMWWHEKVEQLQEQAKPFVSIHPDAIYAKEGFWPALKLTFMQFALGFYGPIMAKQRAEGRWEALHFVDLCAGSGLTQLHSKRSPGKSITVAGSALIGAHESTFDHYHLIEPDPAAARA